ncbi:MAG: hypothetical protein KIH64_016985 [Mycobacterium sp.]|nr:hypothetical protein [Mycobacterium sp.]
MDRTWLRSRPGRLLLAGSLLTALILGVIVVVVHRVSSPRPASVVVTAALSDEQSRQQVLEPARHFVGAGRMRSVNAGYLLSSCASEEQPPYQGLVYLNFDVPAVAQTRAYFAEIANAMVARGWREGLPPGRHPGGRTMVKDGMYAVYYRDPDLPGRGVLKLYGECRNVTDHRQDTTGFVDVSGEVGG